MLSSEPAETEAHRRSFRVDQNGRDTTKDPASRTGNRKVGLYVHGYCLQPGTDAEFDVAGSSVGISLGRIRRRRRRAPPGCTARRWTAIYTAAPRSEEHTSELQSLRHLVCRLL